MLRPDMKYSKFEAAILDLALVLHMEHGGGNNSTIYDTCRFIFRYRYIFDGRGSAGLSERDRNMAGANIKVVEMFDDMKKHIKDYGDEDEIKLYLK